MPPVVRHALMAKSRHDETSTGADKTVVTIRVFCRLCHKKVYKQVKSTYPQRAASVAGDWWRAADGGSPFVYRDSVRSPISRQCKNGSLKRPPENLSNNGRLIRLLKRLSLLFAPRPRRRMTGGDSNVSEMTGGESLAIRLNSSLKRTQTRQSSKNERKTASRSGAEGQKNESGSAARSQTKKIRQPSAARTAKHTQSRQSPLLLPSRYPSGASVSNGWQPDQAPLRRSTEALL